MENQKQLLEVKCSCGEVFSIDYEACAPFQCPRCGGYGRQWITDPPALGISVCDAVTSADKFGG